jgi:hypothetical protein
MNHEHEKERTRMSEEVTTIEPSPLPQLPVTAASIITAEDVALPRLYVGQPVSHAVANGHAKVGSIYAATDAEDPEPLPLYEPGRPGVLIYPLRLVKGWSLSTDGEFQTFPYEDPNVPEDAWLAYHYDLLVPTVDLELPCRFTLSKTGTPTARKINTAMKRHEPRPPWELAFLLTTAPRQNERGRWFVAQATATEPQAEHVLRAGEIAGLIPPAGVTRTNRELARAPAAQADPDAPAAEVAQAPKESIFDDDSIPF